MPADLSWLDGSVEDAATMLADRAVASRALGGVVKAGERPSWADDLLKEAALLKAANPPVPPAAPAPAAPAPAPTPAPTPAPAGDPSFIDKHLGGLKKWVGEQAGAGIRDTFKQSPELQNAITGGLAGAGIGALGGLGATMFSKNKRKRPIANAVFGGMLGGLGGAAIGGLGGAGGLFGKQRRNYQSGVTDPTIVANTDALKNRNEVTVMKTLRGLNAMNNSEIAGSFGRGAGIWAGGETAVRAAGRYGPFGNYTKSKLTADALRGSLDPKLLAHVNAWKTKGVAPARWSVDAVRHGLQGSKLDVAKDLGTRGSQKDIVKALRGGGWKTTTPVADRMKLMTPGTLLRSGKAGLLGTLVGGASKGIDMENEKAPQYIGDLATGLNARYGPTDEQVKKQLDDIVARTRSHGTKPMTQAEIDAYSERLYRLKSQFEMDTLKRLEAQRAAAGNPTGR